MSKSKLLLYFLWLQITGGGRSAAFRKAEYLKTRKIFKSMGEGCYWHPLNIPSFPKLVTLGKNVTICADVKFYEHDIVHRMWNGDKSYDGIPIKQYEGEITIEDNVVVGGSSIILYNVHIGHNSLVAAGSVVTNHVEPYSIVGGNPAKKIGDTRDLYRKRLQFGQNIKEA